MVSALRAWWAALTWSESGALLIAAGAALWLLLIAIRTVHHCSRPQNCRLHRRLADPAPDRRSSIEQMREFEKK